MCNLKSKIEPELAETWCTKSVPRYSESTNNLTTNNLRHGLRREMFDRYLIVPLSFIMIKFTDAWTVYKYVEETIVLVGVNKQLLNYHNPKMLLGNCTHVDIQILDTISLFVHLLN